MACILMKTVACMVALVAIWTVLSTHQAEAAISCGTVVTKVAPCLTYLRNGGQPSSVCCNGIRELRNAASRNVADRKAVCNCLKSASSSYRGVSGNYAASLPGKCGVNIPYKISPSTDCSKIQ